MNQQNISTTPDLPVKRKRGRPRKDETLPRPTPPRPPVAPAPPPPTFIQPPPQPAAFIPPVDHTMVGQVVTCIIDGIFDNGYLLSTRLGPNNTILRGIVFQQGHVAPVTPENDVAPHLKMCTRSEFPIPPANPRNPVQICTSMEELVGGKKPGEAVGVQNYESAPQQESLRLVEQDEVMQVFEVSKASEEELKEAESIPAVIPEVQIPEGNVNPEDNGMECEKRGNEDYSGMEHEHVVEPEQRVKEPEEVIAGMENQGLLGKDELLQESKEQTGELNNIEANQDQSQAVAVDLSLSNFPEI